MMWESYLRDQPGQDENCKEFNMVTSKVLHLSQNNQESSTGSVLCGLMRSSLAERALGVLVDKLNVSQQSAAVAMKVIQILVSVH